MKSLHTSRDRNTHAHIFKKRGKGWNLNENLFITMLSKTKRRFWLYPLPISPPHRPVYCHYHGQFLRCFRMLEGQFNLYHLCQTRIVVEYGGDIDSAQPLWLVCSGKKKSTWIQIKGFLSSSVIFAFCVKILMSDQQSKMFVCVNYSHKNTHLVSEGISGFVPSKNVKKTPNKLLLRKPTCLTHQPCNHLRQIQIS